MTILGNLFIKLAQADSRNTALAYIRSLAKPFNTHLIKIAVWKNDTKSLDHWIQEICNFSEDLEDITLKNGKQPKIKDYIEALYNPFLETEMEFFKFLNKTVTRCINKKYPEPNYIDYSKLYENISNFYNRYFNLLENENIISESDLRHILHQTLIKE